MTNRLALWCGGFIIAFFALDYFVLSWESHLAIMRRLIQLIDYIAIWR